MCVYVTFVNHIQTVRNTSSTSPATTTSNDRRHLEGPRSTLPGIEDTVPIDKFHFICQQLEGATTTTVPDVEPDTEQSSLHYEHTKTAVCINHNRPTVCPTFTSPPNNSQTTLCGSQSTQNTTSDCEFLPVNCDMSDSQTDCSEPQSQPRENIDKECKFIVFDSCLDQLLRFCPRCGASVVSCCKMFTGSQLTVKLSCHNNHNIVWHSQPLLNKMAAGNLLISAAILFSGGTFSNFNTFCELLTLQFLSKSLFYKIQKSVLFPLINTAWLEQQQTVIGYLSGKPIKVSGDGRCDSPGYSAKYCTYSLMEHTSNLIVDFAQVQVTEAGSSNGMEKLACQTVLDRIFDSGLNIVTIATDRHVQIRKLLTEYPVDHQFDVFHVSKTLKKKLKIISTQKDCKDLAPWVHSVGNHLWYCCQTCNNNAQLLKQKWLSLQYHVAGVHQWSDGECEHEPLPTERECGPQWLEAGSPAHAALVKEVSNPTLLRDLENMTQFCHTGELESFHNMLLKYCPKRLGFTYEGMLARTQLAILDHNNNTGREQAKTKQGEPRFNTKFSKQTKTWVANRITVKKNRFWAEQLMCDAVHVWQNEQNVTRPQIPPLPKNIAPIPKPPKTATVNKMLSRFGKN